eukprot:TRINITY_DN49538_c0_g1_i1.p1 TRINITY_DN49538_c0_g1~~TRINITY_DN49538_c0_g1_i1.p1  ORF type:complete len:539 (-),score=120.02 TRINITY_DN49538_c0_g1_i1:103-1509(-)
MARRQDGLEADAQLCNTVVSACEASAAWLPAQALFLDVMQSEGIGEDAVTRNVVGSACAVAGLWQETYGLLVGGRALRLRPDRIGFNSAIAACARGAAAFQRSLDILNIDMSRAKLEPNVITYNAVMSSCEKLGLWSQGLNLLDAFARSSLTADCVTFTSAINACQKIGLWDTATLLLSQAQRSLLVLDSAVYAAVLRSCERGGQWDVALALLDVLRSRDRRETHLQKALEDTGLWNAVISANEKRGRWPWAAFLVEAMRTSACRIDLISVNAAASSLSAAASAGPSDGAAAQPDAVADAASWTKAFCWLREVRREGLEPSEVTWNALLAAHVGTSKWEDAAALLAAMGDHGAKPTLLTYTDVARAVARASPRASPSGRLERGGFDLHPLEERPRLWEGVLALLPEAQLLLQGGGAATGEEVLLHGAAVQSCWSSGATAPLLGLLNGLKVISLAGSSRLHRGRGSQAE